MKRMSLGLGLFFVSGISFTLIYYLFGLPLEAILYAWSLSVFIGTVLVLGYAYRYYRNALKYKANKK